LPREEEKTDERMIKMKKMIFVLALLLMTAPAMAGVKLTATTGSTAADFNLVTISYDGNSTGNIRAFAVNITVNGGKVIKEPTDVSGTYRIFPGTITIWQNDINDPGKCYAPATDPGALEGPGTSGMTLEMGSLYQMGVDPNPPPTGILCKFRVSGTITPVVTITEEVLHRGGVVMENTGVAANPVFKRVYGCHSGCQNKGDATMDNAVNYADLNALRATIFKVASDPAHNPCCDFDRNGAINYGDLNLLRTNIFKPC